jgi:hypothetical protein
MEQLLYATVLIEGRNGKDLVSYGTGFVYTVVLKSGRNIPFLVTNKHVVTDARHARLVFTRRNGEMPSVGQKCEVAFEQFDEYWHGHPDEAIDLTIAPFAPVVAAADEAQTPIFYRGIPSNLLPSTEQLSGLDAVESITFVGYPNGLFDTTNLTPIVRMGTTATPVYLDYCGSPAFLIDASVFPGSSGSPVFVFNRDSYRTKKNGALQVGTRLYFVGVLSSVFFQEDNGDIDVVDIPTAKTPIIRTRQMIDLGYVFKSRLVHDLALMVIKERQPESLADVENV